MRQAQWVAAAVAQYMLQTLNTDVLDNGDQAGFVNLLIQAIYKTAGRTKIVTPSYDLYVATSGSDTANNGTSAAPFATLQHAWDHLARDIDLDGNVATIHVAAGNYGPFVAYGTIVGQVSVSSVNIIGDVATPDNVIITAFNNNCVQGQNAQFTIKGVSVTASGGTGGGLGCGLSGVFGGTIIQFDRMDFGACSNSHFTGDAGAVVEPLTNASYSISGSANRHLYANEGARLGLPSCTINIFGTPHWGQAFAVAEVNSSITSNGCVFAGAATGQRFFTHAGSIINVEGGGPAYFPGDTAGVTDATTYGVYLP